MDNYNSLIKTTRDILLNCDTVCRYLRRQNHYFAIKTIQATIVLLKSFIESIVSLVSKEFIDELLSILEEIIATQSQCNYVYLADLFELKLTPLLCEFQKSLLIDSDVCTDYFNANCSHISEILKSHLTSLKKTDINDGYSVEYTNIGSLTISVIKDNVPIYLHSNGNPCSEALEFAQEYSDNNITDYVIYGLGLGYHVLSLLEYDERHHVTVLEPDINILLCALTYNDFSQHLSSGRLNIVYLDNFANIDKYINESGQKFIIHYPSFSLLEDTNRYKPILSEYFMTLSTIQAHSKFLNTNFHYNQLLNLPSIDVLKEKFYNKNLIYAGGGPSLELYFDKLKALLDAQPDAIFICAGTVYRKILENGLTPDYVIITDPAKILINQVKDIPANSTELLFLSTASKEAVKEFKGNKYIMYQNGFLHAEELAKSNNYTLFETGGSVSTTAIDLGIRFNCTEIYCIGLDLAYTGNETHAFGITAASQNNDNLIFVEAVDGGTIKTINNLNIYRKWIEARIANESNIAFYNMSHGANIKGMQNI